MRVVIQDIHEITESRELLESKPHPFVETFIYILIFLLAVTLTWSYFGEIDDYIKANGVVRPDDKISTIKNKVAGKVEEVLLEEGKRVKKGDTLFSIEHENTELEKMSLERELDKAQKELTNLKKFKQSILEGKNRFDQSKEDEKLYFSKYIQYETSMAVQSKQVELDTQSLQKVKEELTNLELLKQSIECKRNLFEKSSGIYYNRYQEYNLNVQKFSDIMEQKKDSYEKAKELDSAGAISKKELDDSKRQFFSSEIDLQKYQSEYISNLNAEIEKNRKTLKDLEINLKTIGQSLGESLKFDEVSLQKYKVDTLVQIDDAVVKDEKAVESLQKQLDGINLSIEDSVVKAPIDGVVNIITEINRVC